jgi:hypothetical protein
VLGVRIAGEVDCREGRSPQRDRSSALRPPPSVLPVALTRPAADLSYGVRGGICRTSDPVLRPPSSALRPD